MFSTLAGLLIKKRKRIKKEVRASIGSLHRGHRLGGGRASAPVVPTEGGTPPNPCAAVFFGLLSPTPDAISPLVALGFRFFR